MCSAHELQGIQISEDPVKITKGGQLDALGHKALTCRKQKRIAIKASIRCLSERRDEVEKSSCAAVILSRHKQL